MSEKTSQDQPPAYDNEQARQFYRTATNPQRLPKKYWPGKEVEADLFDAAVIGQYEESIERERDETLENRSPGLKTDPDEIYRRELERIAAAAEYVQGVPISEINQAGLDNPVMQREGAFGYVLQVAKKGAKEIKQLHINSQSEQPVPEKAQLDVDKKGSETTESDALEVLPDYVDLEQRIRVLYGESLIDKEDAGSLIMLFEFQKSTASPERQLEALRNIRTKLEKQITVQKFDEELEGSGLKDKTLEKGFVYLGRLIGKPRSRKLGLRPYLLVRSVCDKSDHTPSELKEVSDHVYSHIAYALEKMYRR